MSSHIYEIHNLKQYYGNGKLNINIAELNIGSGITGIVGPNGSGKSTLLKILAFLLPYNSGTIIYNGKPVLGRTELLRREITYLLQDSFLLSRSVYDNIAYGLKLRKDINSGSIKARVENSLLQVGLEPAVFANRQWYQLSGGELQRAALAARLALRPRVLLLDEPTANVDEASARLIMKAAVSTAKEYGTAVIIATHDLPWLYEISTEIFSLYNGRVAAGAENIFKCGEFNDENIIALELTGQQKIFALQSRLNAAEAAMLSPSDVKIETSRPAPQADTNIVSGRIMQIALERDLSSVLVSVDVGGDIIKARMSAEAEICKELFPLREVFLIFPYSAISPL